MATAVWPVTDCIAESAFAPWSAVAKSEESLYAADFNPWILTGLSSTRIVPLVVPSLTVWTAVPAFARRLLVAESNSVEVIEPATIEAEISLVAESIASWTCVAFFLAV